MVCKFYRISDQKCSHPLMKFKFGPFKLSKHCVLPYERKCDLLEIEKDPTPTYKPKKVVGRKIVEDPNFIDGKKRCPTCNRKLFEGTDHERLRNLLAIIHRDGGHYVIRNGIDKACKDAEIIVSYLIHEKREPTKEELEKEREWTIT